MHCKILVLESFHFANQNVKSHRSSRQMTSLLIIPVVSLIIYFYCRGKMFRVKQGLISFCWRQADGVGSKWQIWLQILTCTITVRNGGRASLKSVYSSEKWGGWCSSHRYIMDLCWHTKRKESENSGLNRVFFRIVGPPPLPPFLSITCSRVAHALPVPRLPASSTLTRSHRTWWIEIIKGKTCLIIMSHSSKWLTKQMLAFKLRKMFRFINAKKGNSILRSINSPLENKKVNTN